MRPFGIGARLGLVLMFAAWLLLPPRPGAAQGIPVDLELVLAVDVSPSMDFDELRLQRDGYAAALAHPEVVAAITAGPQGRIAVAYVEWAASGGQAVILPWRLIDGPDAAARVAADLAAAPASRSRGTSISAALAFAAELFDGSGYEGMRRVIDISGDGPNNQGPQVQTVRDAVVAQGIVINGLPLMLKPVGGGGAPADLRLDLYYEDCVIGGFGSFALAVRAPEELAGTIRRKLVLEIAGRMPAPAVTRVTLLDRPPRVDCMVAQYNQYFWP